MTKPYVLLSDIHLHAWSAFSKQDPDGVNSRLRGLLDEIQRAATTLVARGGFEMVISGDLFHVRGKIAPSVLNPTLDLFRKLQQDLGLEIHIIPGNHDLEGRDSDRLGSAVTALEATGCKVYNRIQGVQLHDRRLIMVPWIESVAQLKGELEMVVQDAGLNQENLSQVDLILHAPVNGVIMGIPDHGLEPAELAKLGFGRIFSGHYHNHVAFPGNVYSVGALAHHTWSDVGTTAGFILVGDTVEHVPTVLPRFVDLHQGVDAAQVPKLVMGNYARVKVETSKVSEIEAMRDYLTNSGALGVQVISVKKPTEQRAAGATIQAGASLETSVADFIKTMQVENAGAVQQGALRVLAQAETV